MEKIISNKMYNKAGPMSAAQREKAKRIYLETLAATNRNSVACRAAGISRHCIIAWRKSGFVSQDELDEAYTAYALILRGMISAHLYVHHGRIVDPTTDMWDAISGRRLWSIARSVLPEFGGYKHRQLRFTIDGWIYEEIAEARAYIHSIQQRHKLH